MIGTIFFLVYFWYGLRLLTILPWLLLLSIYIYIYIHTLSFFQLILVLAFMIVGNKALNSLDTLDIPEVKTDISAE